MVDIVKIGVFLYDNRKWLLVLAVILALLSVLAWAGAPIRFGDNIISVNATMDKSNVNMSIFPGADRADHSAPASHPKLSVQCNEKGGIKCEYSHEK